MGSIVAQTNHQTVVAASSIFSPISLLIACSIVFLWKPIFLELGSAIHMNGANYAYLLQISGTTMSLVGAAATLLDSVATSSVSAATAASYLRGEFTSFPLSDSVVTIVILVVFTIACLFNVRSSTSLTLSFFFLHVCNPFNLFEITTDRSFQQLLTMAILMIASVVAWSRHGSDVLASNWELRPRGASSVATAIFNGVCIGFLGVTGRHHFESHCTRAHA
jgi:amino acid transporter